MKDHAIDRLIEMVGGPGVCVASLDRLLKRGEGCQELATKPARNKFSDVLSVHVRRVNASMPAVKLRANGSYGPLHCTLCKTIQAGVSRNASNDTITHAI